MLLPGALSAAPASAGKVVEPLDAAHLVQVSLALVAVLVLIFAAAWLLRRMSRLPNGAQGQLRVLGGLSIGARERVVLIEAGSTQLLLGVAPGRVQTLHVLDQPITDSTTDTQPFAQKLASALRRERPA
jgi:flagellar protein FliO/FliZ